VSRRAIIVDDSATMRHMVVFALEEAGYAVQQAVDGQKALNLLSHQRVDVVITEVNMPQMDGITLVRELRKLPEYKFVPILVLTTESGEEIKQQGRAAGVTGWIVKPFDPEQLRETLGRVLPASSADVAGE